MSGDKSKQMVDIYMNRVLLQVASFLGNASVFTPEELQILFNGFSTDAEIAVNMDKSHGKNSKQQPTLVKERLIGVLVQQLNECDPKLLNASASNLHEFMQSNKLFKEAVELAYVPFTKKENMFDAIKRAETKSALENILKIA